MKLDTTNLVEITGVDLRKFVQKVYELSHPQGLGYLHFQEGGLSDADADALLTPRERGDVLLHLDYVRGRACKMVIWRDEETGKLYIRNEWFDHSRRELKELLGAFDIELPERQENTAA